MDFIAKVEEDRRSGIQEIAGALEKLGARVKQVQPVLGTIVGSSEGLSLEQLKIAGIASVELDRNWGAGMPEGRGKGGMPEAKGEVVKPDGKGKVAKPRQGGERRKGMEGGER